MTMRFMVVMAMRIVPMGIMKRMLDMFGRGPARLAEEGEEHQAPAVEAGQQRGEHADIIGADARTTGRESRLQNAILRIEAGETDAHERNADAGDRQRAERHRPEGDGDAFAQAAIIAHVLLMVHRMDDRAGAQEQQRLEEGVGEEVEHRRAIGADARSEEHVAQLRTGRIGDDALDVGLHRADGRSEQAGRRADEGDEAQRRGRGFEHRRQAADHEHARGDHGGRVDQRRHRGRAFHRVGQPGVEAKLRRLAHRADEQQQAEHRHRVEAMAKEPDGRSGHGGRGFQNFRNGDGVEHQIGAENPHHEAEIAHAVDDECLDRGGIGRRLAEPEADQQIGCQAHAFPAEEHLQQVVGRHQHQHREGEEREIGEEARLVRLLVHIAPAIEVDEAGHAGNHHQHDRRHRVDAQRPLGVEAAAFDPGEQRLDIGFGAAGQERQEDRPAHGTAGEQRAGGDDLGGQLAQGLVAKAGDGSRQQREKDDKLDHETAQPFI